MPASAWPLLEPLSPADRRRLLAAGRRRRFGRREVVFHEGDPGDTMHLVEQGHVAVRVTTPMGDVATLLVIGPGGSFGELALLSERAVRTATAVTLEPTETWALHRNQFEDLRRDHPAVNQFLIDLLAGYVGRLTAQLSEMAFLPADKRVVRRLLALVPLYEEATDIPVTQDDLASLANTSRATVNQVIGRLAASGAVRTRRGSVTVVDTERLAIAAR